MYVENYPELILGWTLSIILIIGCLINLYCIWKSKNTRDNLYKGYSVMALLIGLLDFGIGIIYVHRALLIISPIFILSSIYFLLVSLGKINAFKISLFKYDEKTQQKLDKAIMYRDIRQSIIILIFMLFVFYLTTSEILDHI